MVGTVQKFSVQHVAQIICITIKRKYLNEMKTQRMAFMS